MIEQVHVYPHVLNAAGSRYVAAAYADRMPGGRWEAWLVFFPLERGSALASDRETTQHGLDAACRWAEGVSAVYLQGALRRVLRSGSAPLWRRGGQGQDPAARLEAETACYRRAARALRAFGRRLLVGPAEGRGPREPGGVVVVEVRPRGAAARHAGGRRQQRPPPRPRTFAWRAPAPRAIKQWLDRYVVGQERAKKVLAVAAANHYKRLHWKRQGDDLGLKKSNVLLLGPTGSGKTLLVETLAQVLEVPLISADATRFTEAGYTGADVDDILADLLTAAGGDVALAESGIVYIDEVDKTARRETSSRDVSGEGVQQALLKLLEGSRVTLPAESSELHGPDAVSLDTTDVLFICGGAFAGIEAIVGTGGRGRRIGFGGGPEAGDGVPEALWEVTPRDLVQYGMIPELVGRLPVIVALEPLDEATLAAILTQPQDALVTQYQKLFRLDGVSLRFTEGALRAVARRALALGTGARGLRAVMESVMLELMYEMPRSRRPRVLEVTEDVVELHAAPRVSYER
jgi:ATP-dependent Clp protease ATP-binding subunit ClpX